MKKNKVEVVRGVGKLTSPTSISVNGSGESRTIQARNIIVATGSAPKALPFAPIDEEAILSNSGILALKEVPRRLVIIGGGVIGVEFASAYHSFGAEVTIIEALPRLVTSEDEEISAELQKAFNRRGIKQQLSAKVSGVEHNEGNVVVSYTDQALSLIHI